MSVPIYLYDQLKVPKSVKESTTYLKSLHQDKKVYNALGKGVFIKYGVGGGREIFETTREKIFDPPHRVCQTFLTPPRGGLKNF